MRRRDFTTGLLLVAATRSVLGQERAKQRRVAIVIPAGPVAVISEASSASKAGSRFSMSCAGWAMSKDKALS